MSRCFEKDKLLAPFNALFVISVPRNLATDVYALERDTDEAAALGRATFRSVHFVAPCARFSSPETYLIFKVVVTRASQWFSRYPPCAALRVAQMRVRAFCACVCACVNVAEKTCPVTCTAAYLSFFFFPNG